MHHHSSQRNHQRRPLVIPVEFQVRGGVHNGLVINKSKTGVFIKTGQKLSAGDDIEVIYPFSNFGNKKRMGIIIRLSDHGFAVEFKDPSQ